jgi:Arc/MetJ-type ribon-helix-helix transcriptional regulator
VKITLTPDTEAIVNAAMATGMYVSRSEVIREALREQFDVKRLILEQLESASDDSATVASEQPA